VFGPFFGVNVVSAVSILLLQIGGLPMQGVVHGHDGGPGSLDQVPQRMLQRQRVFSAVHFTGTW
jgi:hypothetical protein